MFTLHISNSLVFRCDIVLKFTLSEHVNFIDWFLFTFCFNITIVTPQHSFQLICFQFIQTRLVKLTGKNSNTYPFELETLHLSSFFSSYFLFYKSNFYFLNIVYSILLNIIQCRQPTIFNILHDSLSLNFYSRKNQYSKSKADKFSKL